MMLLKKRFVDKLFLTNFFILVNDYHMIYNVYYAINQEGELTIITGIQYNGTNTNIIFEIIGGKK